MIKDPLELLQNGAHIGFSHKFLVAIDKGLAVQPEDRPQSISEFRKLLGIGTFVSAQAPGMSNSSGSSSRRAPGSSSGPESIEDAGEAKQKALVRAARKKIRSDFQAPDPTTPKEKKPFNLLAAVLGGGALLLAIVGIYLDSGFPISEKWR
ncbi:MAG: hypothetical protein V4805_05025, partial [Pseudomonadota bacterium]